MNILVLYNLSLGMPDATKVRHDLSEYYLNTDEKEKKQWGGRLTRILYEINNGDAFSVSTARIDEKSDAEAYDRLDGEYDIIVSYHLAGFNLKTLTDSYAYNLYPIPQIHLCTRQEFESLDGMTAINLFFDIIGEA